MQIEKGEVARMISKAYPQNMNKVINVRHHLILILGLATLLFLILALNHANRLQEKAVEPLIQYDVILSIPLNNDSIEEVFIPTYYKTLINKTFYNATNESVFIFTYHFINNKLYIDQLESPKVIYSTTTSIKYMMPLSYNASLHNHPKPYDLCRASDGDLLNNFTITAIYCNNDSTILFYFKETNKSFYYNFTI